MSAKEDKEEKSPTTTQETDSEETETKPVEETEEKSETETPAEDSQSMEVEETEEKKDEKQEEEETAMEEEDPQKGNTEGEEEDEEMETASEGTKSPKNDAKADENLLSEENLDRESPEIWPEKIPGVQDFVQEHASEVESSSPPTWTKGLTQEDVDQMHELGAMSNSQLILEIKKLYDHAYKIGVEESKEMSRGKILQIFVNSRK